MRINTKLFLSFILIAIISSFISTYSAINSISERYAYMARDETQELKKSIENKFYSFLGDISSKCSFISDLDEVNKNFENPEDIATELEIKAFFLASLNTYITNTKNKILCSINRSDTININQDTLNKDAFFSDIGNTLLRKTSIIKIKDNISIISISPIINQESFEKLGNTILEQRIDSEFADKIRENSKSEILIYSKDKIIGTTFIDSNGERHYPEISNYLNNRVKEQKILNDKYLLESFPIEDYQGKKIGDIIIFLNINEILMARQLDIKSIEGATLIVIFFTIFLSIIIGNRLAKPIRNLSKSLKSISEGKFDIELKPTSKDEIGELTSMFNKMAESLKFQTKHIKHMGFYLKNIIDSMPSILVGIDCNGIVTQWNSEAEKKTGINRTEAIGNLVDELFPKFKTQLEIYKKSIKDKIPYNMEKIPIETEKQISYTDIMIYPLITNGITGAVIRMDDVTERVKLVEMMVQTEKMMSVGGLAAGMAHEINNPLGGILIGVQNIQRRISPNFSGNQKHAEKSNINLENMYNYLKNREIIDFLDGIKDAGERASNIVENMLNFSRHSKSDFLPADLIEILDNTIDLAANDYNLKKQYDFKNLNIVREYEKNIPEVLCIKTEIQQVILNLLKNAVFAMFENSKKDRPEPTIFIRLKLEEDQVKIEIEDNGLGIDKNTCKRIFEPFFTTKEVGTGTGLGLSVSYFIITNIHNGSMYVDSTPGIGTKFTIKLPIINEESET